GLRPDLGDRRLGALDRLLGRSLLAGARGQKRQRQSQQDPFHTSHRRLLAPAGASGGERAPPPPPLSPRPPPPPARAPRVRRARGRERAPITECGAADQS